LNLPAALPDVQLSQMDGFGAPSLNLAYGHRTRFDLNIWFDQDTSIHSHAFEGAFGVVFGEATDERGRIVQPVWHHGGDFVLGEIVIEGGDVRLGPGYRRQLTSDPQSFHRVGHLTTPTVLAVLREVGTSAPSYEYFLPGLGIRSTLLADFGARRANLSVLNAALRAGSCETRMAEAVAKLPLRLLCEYALTRSRFALSDDTAFFAICLQQLRDSAADDPVHAAVLAVQEVRWSTRASWFSDAVAENGA
jgi:hypothetical protein